MRLDERRLGLASAAVAAILFSICALFVALVPDAALATFSYVFHLSMPDATAVIGWVGFAVGLVVFSVVVGAHGWALGWTYNRLIGTKPTAAPASQAAGSWTTR